LSKKEIKHSREGPLKHDQTKGGDRPLPPSKNVDLSVNTAAAHQGQHAGTRKAEKKQAEGLFFFFLFFFLWLRFRAEGGDPDCFQKTSPGESTQDHSHQKSSLTDAHLQVPAGAFKKPKIFFKRLLGGYEK
jgi:hypothetical protein